MIEQMETTYFGLLPTFLLLISFKITTFLILLSSNIWKVAELLTLRLTVWKIFIEGFPKAQIEIVFHRILLFLDFTQSL